MKTKIVAILVLALLACSSLLVMPEIQATSSGLTENVTFAEALANTSHILVSSYYDGASQPFTVGTVPVKISWVTVYASSYSSHSLQVAIGTVLGGINIWSDNLTNVPDVYQGTGPEWLNLSISPSVTLNPGTIYYISVMQGQYQNEIGSIDGQNAGTWFSQKNLASPMWNLGSNGPIITNSSYMVFAVGGPVSVYNVSFQLSNSIGATWAVNFDGNNQSSSSSSITFAVPNGTYQFNVPSVISEGITYVASPNSGTVTVNGGNRIVSLSFIGQVYSVSFDEVGLVTGTEWWVNVTGGSSFHSNTSEISFNEPNGFIYFTIGAKGYIPNPSSGTLPVSGKNVSITVSFEKTTNGSGTIIYNNNTVKNYLSQNWPLFIISSLIFILAGWALSYFVNPENRGRKKE